MTKINYQRIYEDEISFSVKDSLELSHRYFELSPQQRTLVDDLIDIGYKSAIEDALDPEVLEETAALAGDMGTQLYNLANVLQTYVQQTATTDDS